MFFQSSRVGVQCDLNFVGQGLLFNTLIALKFLTVVLQQYLCQRRPGRFFLQGSCWKCMDIGLGMASHAAVWDIQPCGISNMCR